MHAAAVFQSVAVPWRPNILSEIDFALVSTSENTFTALRHSLWKTMAY
jgi:hypothetical protein